MKTRWRIFLTDRRGEPNPIKEFAITPCLVGCIEREDYIGFTGRAFALGVVWGHWHIVIILAYLKPVSIKNKNQK